MHGLKVGVVALVAALQWAPATAGGGGFSCGGCATEVTQLLNNAELYAQVQKQVATVRQLADTHLVHLTQLQELVNAGRQLGSIRLPDILQMKGDLEGYQRTLSTFSGDLTSLRSIFDRRLTEARLLNISFPDYYSREAQRIQDGNEIAKARLTRELQTIEQVKRDIELTQQYGARIQGTVGVHQATGLLNSQMNLMTQQLTRLVALTAESQGSDKARVQAEEEADRASALERRKAILDSQKGRDSAADSLIEQMRSPGRGR
ncbi:MAG: hypothetical protein AB7L71_02645 [Vicinamibacterales bacterium]